MDRNNLTDNELLRWASFLDVNYFCVMNNIPQDEMQKKVVKHCMVEKYSMYKHLYDNGINILETIDGNSVIFR